ncbi:murein transglycosylase, partial [Micromonospora sp. NPDC051296]
MADGEESTTLRPLRPATPRPGAAPDGPATGLPRPRRPWLRSARPADGSSGTAPADEPAANTTGDSPTRTDGEPPTRTDGEPPTRTDGEPPAKTDGEPAAKTNSEPATKADSKPAAKTDGEPATKIDGEPAAKSGPDTPPTQSTPDAGPPGVRRRRTRFAHAVRLPGPRTAARATRDWSRRPSGRLTLPGAFLLVLVAVTATAGALLVPATVGDRRPAAADATAGGPEAPGDPPPSGEAPPPGAVPPTPTLPPGATPPTAPGGGLPVGGRPSDA